VFDFVGLKKFPAASGFLGAANRKNEAFFHDFFGMVNLNDFFLCYESCRKNPPGCFPYG
jgi:hypothetical protein